MQNDKELWSYIFENMKDEELLSLSKHTKVKIPGFRQITLNSNFRLLKPKIVSALLTPLRLKDIKKYIWNKTGDSDFSNTIMGKTEEQLLEEVTNTKKAIDIFTLLLTCSDDEKNKMAIKIFNDKKDYLLNKDNEDIGNEEVKKEEVKKEEAKKEEVKKEEAKKDEIGNKDLSIENLRKIIESLESKLNKKDKKIEQVQQQVVKAEQDLNKERVLWKEERKNLTNQVQELSKREKEYEKLSNELRIKLGEQQKSIISLNNTLKEKQQSINHLHALSLKYNENNSQVAVTVERPIKNIAVIGNPRTLLNKRYYKESPTIIDLEQLDQIKNKEYWNEFHEVHSLTFELTTGRLRKLRNTVPGEKLKEFSNINTLISYIENQGE